MNLFKGISLKSVIFGLITQLISVLILSMIFTFILKFVYHSTIEETTGILYGNFFYLLIAMILGLISSMYGGFIAATSSKKDNVNNSLVLGLINALITLYSISFSSETPLWENLIILILIIPVTYWGGKLAVKYKKH